MLIPKMVPALVVALWSTETRAIDWESHVLLTEAGRPLLVSTSDGASDAQTMGETSSLFRRITANGTECEAKDGKTRRIRIVCTAKGTHSVSVYIGTIVGSGQFLIQQVAINTRMLPAAERVAHVKNLLSHE